MDTAKEGGSKKRAARRQSEPGELPCQAGEEAELSPARGFQVADAAEQASAPSMGGLPESPQARLEKRGWGKGRVCVFGWSGSREG